jgi:hypothetical protein
MPAYDYQNELAAVAGQAVRDDRYRCRCSRVSGDIRVCHDFEISWRESEPFQLKLALRPPIGSVALNIKGGLQ